LAERLNRLTTELDEGQLAEVVDFMKFIKTRQSPTLISEPTEKIDWSLFHKFRGDYDGSKIDRAELYDRGLF
jgi:hypothetical protein